MVKTIEGGRGGKDGGRDGESKEAGREKREGEIERESREEGDEKMVYMYVYIVPGVQGGGQ